MAWNVPNFSLQGQPQVSGNWANGIMGVIDDNRAQKKASDILLARKQAQAQGPNAAQYLLSMGDVQGAQAYSQMSDRDADNAFRAQEAERAQKNADRAYGLQAATASRGSSDWKMNDGVMYNERTGETKAQPIGAPGAAGRGKPPAGYEWLPDGTLSAIVGGPATEMPAELAARMGMAEKFLGEAPKLREQVKAGKVTGIYDVNKARYWGTGEQGGIYRGLESGVDALRRMLTGAGMPAEEAGDYVRRYMPTGRDNSDSLTSKFDGLVTELQSMKASAQKGRVPRGPNAPQESPPPASTQETAAPSAPSAPAQPKTTGEYHSLPPGTQYMAPDGTIRTKR
jgi:hypothetical protein